MSTQDDEGFAEEIRTHLALETERLIAEGLDPRAARDAARRTFGNVTAARERFHEATRRMWLAHLVQDLRYGLRTLIHNPIFAAAVVLTLALGIGANTAIFSLYSAVLLKPLPYADPDRIVMLWEDMNKGTLIPVSPANFDDWRRQSRSFSAVAAINVFPNFVLTGHGEPARLAGAAVSWDFFSLLGAPMAMGRTFLPEEDQPDRNRVAILSHATWVDRFGARPDVLGTAVSFNETPYTVVGVLPAEFEFAGKQSDYQGRNRFDVWVPLALNPQKLSRGSHSLRVFARLAPGTTLEQAQADVDIVAATLSRAYPEENKSKGIRAVPLREHATADVRLALLTLLGAVGFVLLIACANVASLLLTRAAARQKETAVRLALGASRGRIAQQLLVESLLLGVIGGGLGLVSAMWAVSVAGPYLPADLSRAAGVALDWRVLGFTGALSLVTSGLFGLAPLLQARRVRAHDSLSHGTRVAGGLQTRLRSALVIAQIAVTLTLLIGAGLMTRSLWALLHVPVGFRSDHVLTARVTLPRVRYADAARVAAFHRDVLERLRRSPGVAAAGVAAYLPLTGDDNGWAFFIEGRPPGPVGAYDVASYRPVSDGYFDAMDMAVLRGRAFTPADSAEAPLVVAINARMARTYWGDQNPVGQRLRFGGPQWRTVVGVVADIRHESLGAKVQSELYVPIGQTVGPEIASTLVVRTATDAAAMTSTLRAVVSAVDPSVPLDRVRTMEEWVAGSVGEPRFRAWVFAGLALLALVMASVGIYGVTNYTVVQRTRELGICLAVGATTGHVLRLVLGRAAVLIALGLGLGLLGSLGLTRLIAGMLFGVAPLDASTFAGVSLLLLVVAAVASYVPARRATRIDPVVALRYE